MSEEEASAHRAPGTIVRNSVVFRDRSARRAAASRSFSPRGLLWLFLRKKEQEKDFLQGNAGRSLRSARPCGGPPLAEASARAAPSAAVLRRLKPATIFFVLLACPKSTKKSSTAKSCGCRRRRSLSGHKRLRFLHTRSGRSRRRRHFFRAFRSASVQAFGLLKSRIPTRGSAVASCRPYRIPWQAVGLHIPAM